MRGIDFSTWQTVVSTVLGLALITLIGVGVRLLVMFTIQQRRDRENRQINERLRTLIAAYKTLGGSFTGDLSVDPTHLRDVNRRDDDAVILPARNEGSDRTRRIRDAVEAALSDIILLGTDDQVRLAASAARELAEGRPVHTADLVISLRNFIRNALGLDEIPDSVGIPRQGPTRPSSSGGRGGGGGEREGRGGGGGGGGGMGAAAGAGGLGLGVGMASHHPDDEAKDK